MLFKNLFGKKIPLSSSLILIALRVVLFVCCALFSFRDYFTDYHEVFPRGYLRTDEAMHIAYILDQSKIPNVVKRGSSVYVSQDQLRKARMQLAHLTLPEIYVHRGIQFVDIQNQQNSNKRFNIAKLLHLQKELENDITSNRNIRRAKVFFDISPAKAVVWVDVAKGDALKPKNVHTIIHHIASRVRGLDTSRVIIVDAQKRIYGDNAIYAEFTEYALEQRSLASSTGQYGITSGRA